MCPTTAESRLVTLALILALMILGCSEKGTSPTGSSFTLPNVAVIYLDNTRQVIRGFGGANIRGWRPDMTADEVNTAFGTGNGQIGMSILRIRVPHDSSESGLEVTTAKKAYLLGAIIIASPWTPPAWMKSSDNIVGGTLNTGSYASYAAHLKAFAETMSNNGVPLYAISVQNEPEVTVTYESCSWNASQLLSFVKNNASAIGTRIIVPESGNFNHALSDPILNDHASAANVSIIGGHIYGGGLTSYPLALIMGKEVWMTEHLVLDTDWPGALATGKEINDCMNADMSAYIWWYIVRYYGPIDENGEVTKRGYVMSQYARFIRPGFVRVSATANPQLNVYVTAYKNGSKVVIVALNNGSSSVTQLFTLRNGAVSTFTPYVTSSTKNCAQGYGIAVSNGGFLATLDPSSATTFVSN